MFLLTLLVRGAQFLGPTLPPVRWGVPHSHLPFRQRLVNYQNVQYHGAIRVGGQLLKRGIFDTGSFDLLVVSQSCGDCLNPPYSPSESSSFQPSTRTSHVRHDFGSGPTVSARGYEVVEVGPLAVLNQSFYEIVGHNISVLDDSGFDAIVGIGRKGDLEDRSLLANLNISSFSICLERPSMAPGWLTWGAPPPTHGAELTVVGEHHWAVSMTGFLPAVPLSAEQLGAAELLLCGSGCGAVLDSGTSLIAAPGHALQALEMLLPPLHENCSNLHALPDLSLTLDGHRIALPPEAYVLRMEGTEVEADDAWDFLFFKPTVRATNQCFYAFMQMDQRTQFGPLWVLGMPLFRYFSVTFSPGERRVWLQKAAADCTPEALETERVAADGVTDYPFPDMVVAQRARARRELLTVDPRALRPPRGFASRV